MGCPNYTQGCRPTRTVKHGVQKSLGSKTSTGVVRTSRKLFRVTTWAAWMGRRQILLFSIKKEKFVGRPQGARKKRHLFATTQRPSHSLLASCTCVGNTAWAMAAEDIASKQCSAQSCALHVGCMPITHCTTGRLIHLQAHRRPCTWSMLRPARFRCDSRSDAPRVGCLRLHINHRLC